jgi:hypothetical protein
VIMLRFISMLMAFALAFSSLGMTSVMAATPNHHAPAASVHCADHDEPSAPANSKSSAAADCAIACSALTPLPVFLGQPCGPVRELPRSVAPGFHVGTSPESEPPPPRIA